MSLDHRGLFITGADERTAAMVRRFQHALQAFRDDAGEILMIAEAAQACPVVQAYAAAIHLYGQTQADIRANALPLVARAERHADSLTERERKLVAAVAAWARCDFATAVRRFEEIVAAWPEDLTAIKFAEFVFFESPDFPRHLRLMEAAAPANRDSAPFLAMQAFANELNGHYEMAQSLAEQAIALEFDTPWAHHALAHVYLNTGRLADGLQVLDRFAATWMDHGAAVREHNVWHVALLHLGRLDSASALRLYHQYLCTSPESVFEHTDAISLLWRLDLVGEAVGADLWQRFVPHARARIRERVMPFLNAHYAYALVRAGHAAEAEEAVAELAAEAVQGGAIVWETGVTLMRGVIALARGDGRSAAGSLERVFESVRLVGGSDAQNDLFRLSCVRAMTLSGRRGEAAAMMAQMVGGRALTSFEEALLAKPVALVVSR
ncbi:hypothetical protein [Segnochrobactrum spirostomi]|uniref:Tetratricopeptide repeat protein 38 n=1 Tax=Segnochrobactrum spirostomi TaxID=2608987 RepID=A0A6A7Y594_9HYPH|nr:hypothetical protein [Segnochrobactrum spirostomi]MQT12839.1 hypothetical protein [Segnochrobactrum spirostomi]